MTGFRGADDAGRQAEPLVPENLQPLLAGAPGWVRVESVDDPRLRAEARREDGDRWTLEVQPAGGSPLTARVPNTDAAFDALRSWAADDGWWREAFTWQPAG
jgi:hypothetical protein